MRLELTAKTDLAVHALRELDQAGADSITKGADLAEALGITIHYTPQVMGPLVTAGWVESTSGPAGGYVLVADLEQISLLQVIEAVEGSVEASKCVLTGAPCPDSGPCAMHEPWSRARSSLLSELESTPIAHVRSRAPEKERNHAK